MKAPWLSLLLLAQVFPALAANPEVGAAIVRQFGEAQLQNVILVTAAANETDPVQWTVFSRDPYREGDLLRSIATNTNGVWDATPAGAGRLLQRVPSQRIDFKRLKVDSKEARRLATAAAALAKVTFTKVGYQLAANEQNGSPEWGLAFTNQQNLEVGFCIVSGETGAVTFQDWTADTPVSDKPLTEAEKQGAEAAQRVKKGVRKAWDWTEDAGKKTGGFFRELFK